MLGIDGGEETADDPYVAHSFDNIGAVILGRNMYSTSRGPWTDDGWTGWWGPNPPYHAPTFVLTHHPRDPLPMEGGTTFHFATGGIDDTLERAFASAEGKDVRVIGGGTTIRQYLGAELIDELHLVRRPDAGRRRRTDLPGDVAAARVHVRRARRHVGRRAPSLPAQPIVGRLNEAPRQSAQESIMPRCHLSQ